MIPQSPVSPTTPPLTPRQAAMDEAELLHLPTFDPFHRAAAREQIRLGILAIDPRLLTTDRLNQLVESVRRNVRVSHPAPPAAATLQQRESAVAALSNHPIFRLAQGRDLTTEQRRALFAISNQANFQIREQPLITISDSLKVFICKRADNASTSARLLRLCFRDTSAFVL